MRVLVVEESQQMRSVYRSFLRNLGYTNVDFTPNGKEAFAILKTSKENPVSFVISDWDIPGMSGLDLLRAIRHEEPLKTIPVLLVTGEADTAHIMAAVKAGVNGYVVKPFTQITLEEKISAIFKNKT